MDKRKDMILEVWAKFAHISKGKNDSNKEISSVVETFIPISYMTQWKLRKLNSLLMAT